MNFRTRFFRLFVTQFSHIPLLIGGRLTGNIPIPPVLTYAFQGSEICKIRRHFSNPNIPEYGSSFSLNS